MANRYDSFASGSLNTPDDGGAAWERPVEFSFGVAAGRLQNNDGGPDRFCILPCGADGTFDIKFVTTTNLVAYPGVIVRYADASNWALVQVHTSGIYFSTRIAGTFVSRGGPVSSVAANDVISVAMSGDSYTIKKNGTAVLGPYTISGLSSNTKHGVRTDYDNTTQFDDVVWTEGAAAPTVSTQPTAQSVTAPAAATFTAAVTGTYTGLRWQRQAAGAGAWADISGATSTTLTTGATSVSGGSWNSTDRVRLAVDWSSSVVYSIDVPLTVAAGGTAPAFTVQPSNQSVTVGATATFTATATGSGTLTHQWQRQPAAGGGYVDISGATSASYTTPVTTISGGSANNGDTYRRVTTGDTSPPATSNAATLTVLYPVATTVSLTLYGADGTTPAANLTNLKWAFWDRATPDLIAEAPIAKGAVEATDGSGVFSASITGTALRQNDIGYLIVTNSDGTVTQGAALKAFAGPVAVS